MEELENTPEFQAAQKREFAEDLPVQALLSDVNQETVTPRRGFLKMLGFGASTLAAAACNRTPVKKAIPYLVKPEEITPGVPAFYASALPDGYSVLVKTREGRPIKIEGNPGCPVSKGGVDAIGHASVASLYDNTRLKGPKMNRTEASWDDIDQVIISQLRALDGEGKQAVILSPTIISPSTKKLIGEFIEQYPNVQHIQYDAVSQSAVWKANRQSFGKPVVPAYRFDRADVIVSIAADFLGTWISPVEYSKQYVHNRGQRALKEDKKMSRHYQFESALSMTGTNADARVPVKPSQLGLVTLALYNEVARITGGTSVQAPELPEIAAEKVKQAAKELAAAKGRSLVVCGLNDVAVQEVVNSMNVLLGSYGKTIDLENPSYQYRGDEATLSALVNRMNGGKIGALFFYGVNPVYDFPQAKAFTDALGKVKMKISFSDREDETAAYCNIIAPDHSPFESWNDYQPRADVYVVGQPTINPIFNTRQVQQGLLAWMQRGEEDYHDYIRAYWEQEVLPAAGGSRGPGDAGENWEMLLKRGFAALPPAAPAAPAFSGNISALAAEIKAAAGKQESDLELVLYQKVGLRDGRYANNPWLLEMPDPVSKVTWDNYAALSPVTAGELGLKQNDLVEVKAGGHTVELPVLIQPGQAAGTVAVALGYGRTACGKAGNGVGKNAYPFVELAGGNYRYIVPASLEKTGKTRELAQTQTHHSVEGRDVVRETTLEEYLQDNNAGSQPKHDHGQLKVDHQEDKPFYSLWDEHPKPGHHWAMAIDLNSCTGCSACIISCSLENNVPVVGRDEVRRRRDMHWIRIDRYYAVDEENPENIEVTHQPMLCQHCDHAPCETVCPVLATMHSSDGLNQMAYNRCFGTRYCANNCPYKVRRFNWFNYANNDKFEYYMNNDLGKLALNPDVVVRSRGVMEKCTFCAQRIQAGKLNAKMERRPLKDGEIETACSSSCPADAITFGDMNDPDSRVSRLLKDERTYYALEELNVQPGIGYMTRVRNKPAPEEELDHHEYYHMKEKKTHQENIYKDLLRPETY